MVMLGLIRGKRTEGVSHEQAMAWLVEALRVCASVSGQAGVRLVIEPINRFEADFTMAGSWAFELQAKVPGVTETVDGTVVFKAK